jgi:hypothetical protein
MKLNTKGTIVSAVYAVCALLLLVFQFHNVLGNIESDFLLGAPAFIAGHIFITRKFEATHELIRNKENINDR